MTEKYDCVLYKCSICGEIVIGKPVGNFQRNLLQCVCDKKASLDCVLGDAPVAIVHKCKDGSVGMAYFAGFRKDG